MADYRTAGIKNADGSVNRGLANNNPGDIKYDGTQWQGMVGNDGTFVTFADTTWGLRAMAIDLTTKMNKDGLDTITEIITQYAPPAENDTDSYISAVSSDTGFDPDQVLSPDAETLASLIRAIVNHEIGDSLSQQYITDGDITAGIGMMSSLPATVQAAAIAVANNQGGAAIIALGGIILIGFLFFGKKR